ncbi:hypothetical protein ACFSCV_02735 [Methylopila henanensis]|uniref:Exo-alpha-sialidase n=1 Tax=Methylopila henanensis TaxID=873516 RepID=A0ABW4K1D1_9HYPH
MITTDCPPSLSGRIRLRDAARTNVPLRGKAAYFSLMRSRGVHHLYYRGGGGSHSFTLHRKSVDGVTFGKAREILSASYACHNLYVFEDGGRVRAIGGQFHPGGAFPHADGLHQFDMPRHGLMKDGPLIVTPSHDGFVDATVLWGKESEFDGHLSCVPLDGTGRRALFLRANPERGVRRVQFAVSEPTRETDGPLLFGRFEPVRIDDAGLPPGDYYYPAVSRVDDRLIGFFPFFTADYCSIRVLSSRDGRDWSAIDDLFPSTPWRNELGDPKNSHHPVNGVIDEGDHVLFYVHHNYYRLGGASAPFLTRYAIDKSDLAQGAVRMSADGVNAGCDAAASV